MLELDGLFTFFVESCGLYNVFSINQIKKTAYLDIYTYEIGIIDIRHLELFSSEKTQHNQRLIISYLYTRY